MNYFQYESFTQLTTKGLPAFFRAHEGIHEGHYESSCHCGLCAYLRVLRRGGVVKFCSARQTVCGRLTSRKLLRFRELKDDCNQCALLQIQAVSNCR